MKNLTLLDLCLQDNQSPNQPYLQSNASNFQPHDSKINGVHSPISVEKTIFANPHYKQSRSSPVTRQIDMMMQQLGVSNQSHNLGQSDYFNQDNSHFTDVNPDIFYRIDACQSVNQEFVPIDLFRDVIYQIQQRLLDYEARLANKEQLEHVSQKYQKQNNLSDKRFRVEESNYVNEVNIDVDPTSSNLDKSQERSIVEIQRKNSRRKHQIAKNDVSINSNSPIRPSDQEFFYGRISLFDKKFKLLEEKIVKSSKENDEFKKDIQKKIDISLKKVEDQLGKFSKQGKDMVGKFDELGDSQKQIILHLNKLKDDKQLQTVEFNLFQQHTQERQQSCEGALTLLSQLANNTSEEFQDVKSSVQSLEVDLIMIMKNYKDMLMDMSHNQILKQDVEYLQYEFKQIVHQFLSNR